MLAVQFSHIQTRWPEGRAPRAGSGRRQGRLADRRGGPGDAVNRVDRPAGDITCLACWFLLFAVRFLCTLFHVGSSLASLSRYFLHPIRFSSASSRRLAAVALVIVFASSACVSTQHSDAHQMRRVLEAEDDLLQKLKVERRHPPLIKKLRSDETLADAEDHLRDAIDALIKANAELRSAVNNR